MAEVSLQSSPIQYGSQQVVLPIVEVSHKCGDTESTSSSTSGSFAGTRSRIPRPIQVHQRCMDQVLLVQEVGVGASPRNRTQNDQPVGIGHGQDPEDSFDTFATPNNGETPVTQPRDYLRATDRGPVANMGFETDTRPIQNISKEDTSDLLRKPRYQGTFSSYEEMLNHMETTDPFNGPPPEKHERPPTRRKPPSNRPIRTDLARTPRNLSRSKSEDKPGKNGKEHSFHRTRRKEKTIDIPSGNEHKKIDLNDTYTLGTDNPPHQQHHENEATKDRPLDRKNSNLSIGTYVVELETKAKSKQQMETNKPMVSLASQHDQPLERPEVNSWASFSFQDGFNENTLRDFVRELDLNSRECSKYIKDKGSKDGQCGCGRPKDWHPNVDPRNTASTFEVWSPDKHTKSSPTDTFGTISFKGFGAETNRYPLYVRVDHKVNLKSLQDLLTDSRGWNLHAPKLILSVTGGAKLLVMKDRLRNIIKRGIVNAAASTDAWIITGGTNAGVMALVGEAVRDHLLMPGSSKQKIVALGMVSWGIIEQKDSLVSGGDGLFPAEYCHAGHRNQSKKVRAAWLDSNHTHFIMVDNGTEQKYGQEIEVWTALVQHISKNMETNIGKNKSVHVPTVVLVLDGGEHTLITVMKSIEQDTPVVVVQGSGRAADYIAFAYHNTKSRDNEEETHEPPKFEAELKQKAETLFELHKRSDPSEKAKSINKCVRNVRKCLEKRHLLTVFNHSGVDSASEIDQAILYALLKAKKTNAQSQLNLALAWNRPDIVKEHIFSLENRKKYQNLELEEAMLTALVQDKPEFVQLFKDYSIRLRKFLTWERLHKLYAEVVNDYFSGSIVDLLRNMIQEKQSSNIARAGCGLCCRNASLEFQLVYVGRVIKDLMGDQQRNFYKDKRLTHHHEQAYINEGTALSEHDVGHMGGIPRQGSATQGKLDFPERELFLWAILLNRQKMALMFWKCGKDHIGAALTASALLKSLSYKAHKEEEVDLAQNLSISADEWEERAIGVLNECYLYNKPKAHLLLIREVDTWGNITLLNIANSAYQMDFMGHTCCQTKLNNIWKGKMALYTPMWKIILTMFVPFCLTMIKFNNIGRGRKIQEKTAESKYANNISMVNMVNAGQRGKDSGENGGGDEGGGNGSTNGRTRIGLYQIGCRDSHKRKTINILHAALYYYTAPVTKFLFHTLSYLIFLGLFSYFVLTDLHPISYRRPSNVEVIVWLWAVSFVIEEIRQIHSQQAHSIYYKLQSYYFNMWNRFDQVLLCMLIISVILRLILSEADFVWARMFYCITLGLFFMRLLEAFHVAMNVGPKVIMISRMLTDLMFFLCILAVFLLGFGVAIQALRFPNSKPEWSLLIDLVYRPYWQMYAELFLEELEGDVGSCTNNATLLAQNQDLKPCPQKSWLAILLLAVYMVMTNILLLNLLIAMFSYTFERVQENSEKVWRFHRYNLVQEYFQRPTIAPPFIILNHLFRIMRACCRKGAVVDDFCVPSKVIEPGLKRELTAFEREGMEKYLLQQHTLEREQIDVKVSSAGERIEKVIEDMEILKEQITSQGDGPRPVDSHTAGVRSGSQMSELLNQVNALSIAVSDQASELHRVGNLLKNLMTQQGSGNKLRNPQIEIQDES